MDMLVDRPSRFETDNDLSNHLIVEKYRIAGDIANETLKLVLARVRTGVSVHALCKFGDDLIAAYTSKIYNKPGLEKGAAMPTSICINNQIQYQSPPPEEDIHLKDGDLVKIELAVHVDGYIASVSHTAISYSTPPTAPTAGPHADVIAAAHLSLEAALRLLKPGQDIITLSQIITRTSSHFECNPVTSTGGSTMRRFIREVPNGEISNQASVAIEDGRCIETGKVYYVNIVVSTGPGMTKPDSRKASILARDARASYQLKLKSARAALSYIQSAHSIFPFPIYSLPQHARLGLKELINHGFVHPLQPVKSSDPNEVVAQFGATVLMTPTGALRITLPQQVPWVQSKFQISPEIDKHLASGVVKTVKVAKMEDLVKSGEVEFEEPIEDWEVVQKDEAMDIE